MPRRKQPRAKRIAPEQLAEIRRLYVAGQNPTEIMKSTGISRPTIYRTLNEHKLIQGQNTDNADTASYFDGPIERCPRCGRKVHMPCMPCRINTMIDRGQVPESKIQKADRRQIVRDW